MGKRHPASLMSSRQQVDSCPRSLWGRSSVAQSTRLSAGTAPVRVRSSPLRGGRGVTEASEVVDLAAPVRPRPATPCYTRSLSKGELTALSPRRLALWWFDSTPTGTKLWRQSSSLATSRSGFDSRRLHSLPISSLRSVNGKHAPFVRPRCGFDSCRRLLSAPVAQWIRALPRDGSGR